MKILALISALLQLSGFVLILYFGNWQLALGVFLVIWGSNVGLKYFNK